MRPAKPNSTAVMARRGPVDTGAPLFDGHGGGALVSEPSATLPFGHTAVMQNRAPVAPGELDYFPTPPWAARAGGELIQRLDPGTWSCWEPACGGGHMAHGLADYFSDVDVSDIHDHGCVTDDGGRALTVDFLSDEAELIGEFDWIVTNPPFVMGPEFVRAAWRRARRGVAMLLRVAFLEGVARHHLFTVDCPLSCMAQFAERVPMVKGRWDPDASSATAYAWFVWIKPEAGVAPAAPLLTWIPPGSKARLSRESDARFLPQVDGLFDGEARP